MCVSYSFECLELACISVEHLHTYEDAQGIGMCVCSHTQTCHVICILLQWAHYHVVQYMTVYVRTYLCVYMYLVYCIYVFVCIYLVYCVYMYGLSVCTTYIILCMYLCMDLYTACVYVWTCTIDSPNLHSVEVNVLTNHMYVCEITIQAYPPPPLII